MKNSILFLNLGWLGPFAQSVSERKHYMPFGRTTYPIVCGIRLQSLKGNKNHRVHLAENQSTILESKAYQLNSLNLNLKCTKTLHANFQRPDIITKICQENMIIFGTSLDAIGGRRGF